MQFEDMIKGKINELSIGQRKVGSYILSHLEESSYATLAKMSKETGVSETTVIRFSYTLGFESYSAMQSALQKELLGSTGRDGEDVPETDPYLKVMHNEIQILNQTLRGLSSEDIRETAEKLYSAERVYSVADRTMYPSALWFKEILEKYRDNVTAIQPSGEDFFQGLMDVKKKAVVVAVSFSRYSKAVYQFVKLAKERGAWIAVITDDPLCELASLADVVFLTGSNKNESGINTISSATAVLNVLANAVFIRDRKKAVKRLKDLEELYQRREGTFVE